MRLLAIALGLSLLGGCGGLLVASSLVAFPARVRTRLVPWLVSYAVGALLGVALLDLLPEALHLLAPGPVFGALLAGILLFFTPRCAVLLRHCHADECEVHGATATILFIGDAFHNFIDGAIVSVAVMSPVLLGISTAVAAAHEISQEVGDVAILLASGYKGRAPLLNIVSGGSGRHCWPSARWSSCRVNVVLMRSAASLLHRDVGPDSDLHRGEIDRNAFRQVLLIAAGIGTIVFSSESWARWPSTRTTSRPSRRCGAAKWEAAATAVISRIASATRSGATSCSASPSRKRSTPRAGPSAPALTGCVPIHEKWNAAFRGFSGFRLNVVLHRLEQEENKAEAEHDELMARLSDPTDRQDR